MLSLSFASLCIYWFELLVMCRPHKLTEISWNPVLLISFTCYGKTVLFYIRILVHWLPCKALLLWSWICVIFISSLMGLSSLFFLKVAFFIYTECVIEHKLWTVLYTLIHIIFSHCLHGYTHNLINMNSL